MLFRSHHTHTHTLIFVYVVISGAAVSMILCSFMFIWYFGLSFGWAIYFMIRSFYPVLGWSTCGNSWNTKLCVGWYTCFSVLIIPNKNILSKASENKDTVITTAKCLLLFCLYKTVIVNPYHFFNHT